MRKIFQFISFRIVGRARTKKVLYKLFNLLDLDPLETTHNMLGVNNYGQLSDNGELYLVQEILQKYLTDKRLVFFDVGANVGNYSKMLLEKFEHVEIFAFEPNPASFEKLRKRFLDVEQVHPIFQGLGSCASKMKIYTYSKELDSEHASLVQEVMEKLHHSVDNKSIDVEIITLDNFCLSINCQKIDFLKIDTEGFELEVLKGGRELISQGKIKIIQFEFNEMNIYSRVFLRDFFELLSDYNLYRLLYDSLLPLNAYTPSYEIFRYQNIVAIHKMVGINDF